MNFRLIWLFLSGFGLSDNLNLIWVLWGGVFLIICAGSQWIPQVRQNVAVEVAPDSVAVLLPLFDLTGGLSVSYTHLRAHET